MDRVATLLDQAKKQLAAAEDLQQLNQLRIEYLGKKGSLTAMLQSLGSLPQEERPKLGQAVNKAKNELSEFLKKRHNELSKTQLEKELQIEALDVTLPGRGQSLGSLHPVTRVKQRLEELFVSIGFDIVSGPEIEDEFHNFTALNIPSHHPSRSDQDTFYLENSVYLLRTQTSPVQIRAMETMGVPLRIITPGRVYRCDSDATHVPMFHQLEGLLVDEHVTFAELKGLLNNLLDNFFEEKVELRFRASYFPFTEPSAEVDLKCVICGGKGCRLCGGTGWIEVLGCGMVHPHVLGAVGVDSERYNGFAFGIGIDRFAMFRYQLNDLRALFENDIRFLEQF